MAKVESDRETSLKKPGFLESLPSELHGFFLEHPDFFDNLADFMQELMEKHRSAIWDRTTGKKTKDGTLEIIDIITSLKQYTVIIRAVMMLRLKKQYRTAIPISTEHIAFIADAIGRHIQSETDSSLSRADWCRGHLIPCLLRKFQKSMKDELREISDSSSEIVTQSTETVSVIGEDEKKSEVRSDDISEERLIAQMRSEVDWIFEEHPGFLKGFALFFRSSTTMIREKMWDESIKFERGNDIADREEQYESLIINSLTRYVKKHHAKSTSLPITAADIALIAVPIARYFQVKCIDGLRREDWCKRTFCSTLITKLSYGANTPWFVHRMPIKTHLLFDKLPTLIEDTAEFVGTLPQPAKEKVWDHSVGLTGSDGRKTKVDQIDTLFQFERLLSDVLIVCLKYIFPKERQMKSDEILPVAKPLALFVRNECGGSLTKTKWCKKQYVSSILGRFVDSGEPGARKAGKSDAESCIKDRSISKWSWVSETCPSFFQDWAEFVEGLPMQIREKMWNNSVGSDHVSADLEQSQHLIKTLLLLFIRKQHRKDQRLNDRGLAGLLAKPLVSFIRSECDGSLTRDQWCENGFVSSLILKFSEIELKSEESLDDTDAHTAVIEAPMSEPMFEVHKSEDEQTSDDDESSDDRASASMWDALVPVMQVFESLGWTEEKVDLPGFVVQRQLPIEVHSFFEQWPEFLEDLAGFLAGSPTERRTGIWRDAVRLREDGSDESGYKVADIADQSDQFEMLIFDAMLFFIGFRNALNPPSEEQMRLMSKPVSEFVQRECHGSLTKEDWLKPDFVSSMIVKFTETDADSGRDGRSVSGVSDGPTIWDAMGSGLLKIFGTEGLKGEPDSEDAVRTMHGARETLSNLWGTLAGYAGLVGSLELVTDESEVKSERVERVSTILEEYPSFWDDLADFIDECGMEMKKDIWDAVMTDLEVIETREQWSGLLRECIDRFNPSVSIDDTTVLMRPLLTWIINRGSLSMADFIEKDRLSSLITEYQLLNDVDTIAESVMGATFHSEWFQIEEIRVVFEEYPSFFQNVANVLRGLPERAKAKIWDRATGVLNGDGTRDTVDKTDRRRHFQTLLLYTVLVYLKVQLKNRVCPMTKSHVSLIIEPITPLFQAECGHELTRREWCHPSRVPALMAKVFRLFEKADSL